MDLVAEMSHDEHQWPLCMEKEGAYGIRTKKKKEEEGRRQKKYKSQMRCVASDPHVGDELVPVVNTGSA